ncbi:MAG: CidA/LrgA family protein [Marinobacter sp.]|uniref:CidA/LrgA family protein n=1 Tax=Marinobacter sp. TaxID=50741 RepID=UPI00396F0ED6
MQFLNGITLLLVYQLVGEVTVRLLGVPIPGPVLGMVMLFITLWIRGSAPESVEMASTALLSHLSLLFVPAGVGMMAHFSRIADEWLPITLALLISTVITMVATALVMQLTTRWLVGPAAKQEDNHE